MVKSKTMTTESTITTTEQITYDSDMMSAELDKIQLNKSQTIKGILRLVICSAIGIAAFFVSVPHNGRPFCHTACQRIRNRIPYTFHRRTNLRMG